MKKTAILFISILAWGATLAQQSKKDRKVERRMRINALVKQEEEGVIAYRKHFVYGAKLNSDGYGLFMEIGRARSIRTALLFQLEIAERKHPREEKQVDPTGIGAPIIYGKENFVYPIRLGAQFQYLLGNKSNKNGVSISVNGGGGVAISLLRPYMVEVLDNNGQRRYVKYDNKDSALFLTPPYFGGPRLGTGWKFLKVAPGLYSKLGVRFDYGRFNETVSAIEAGVMGEFYTSKVPQMVFEKQRQFFFSAYVGIIFGRRK
jgi:hypothetical protein